MIAATPALRRRGSRTSFTASPRRARPSQTTAPSAPSASRFGADGERDAPSLRARTITCRRAGSAGDADAVGATFRAVKPEPLDAAVAVARSAGLVAVLVTMPAGLN